MRPSCSGSHKRPPRVVLSSSSSSSPTSSSTLSWLPSNEALAKLFVAGATVGPVVDSLHNQCLLEYHKAPISIPYPPFYPISLTIGDDSFLFCSSWTVPPLLGIAYVVLGGIFPRIAQKWLSRVAAPQRQPKSDGRSKDSTVNTETVEAGATPASKSSDHNSDNGTSSASALQTRALLAVASTALIVKLSALLETHKFTLDSVSFLSPLLDSTTVVQLWSTLLF